MLQCRHLVLNTFDTLSGEALAQPVPETPHKARLVGTPGLVLGLGLAWCERLNGSWCAVSDHDVVVSLIRVKAPCRPVCAVFVALSIGVLLHATYGRQSAARATHTSRQRSVALDLGEV